MKIVQMQPMGAYLYALDSTGQIWRANAAGPAATLRWEAVRGPSLPRPTRKKKGEA